MTANTSKALVRRAAGTPRARTRGASARPLLADVRGLILAAREGVARAVNAGLVLLYWEVGRRIRQDILREKRAEYGERIVYALSRQLTVEFGRGFSRPNLFHMVRFAEVWPDPKIVHALSAQLGWTQVRQIIYLGDSLKRDFYVEMCRVERWNSRTLGKKIQSMLFERTALSRKPEKLNHLRRTSRRLGSSRPPATSSVFTSSTTSSSIEPAISVSWSRASCDQESQLSTTGGNNPARTCVSAGVSPRRIPIEVPIAR